MICANTKCCKEFVDKDNGLFITCPSCRKACKDVPGGCNRWHGVDDGPRVFKHGNGLAAQTERKAGL